MYIIFIDGIIEDICFNERELKEFIHDHQGEDFEIKMTNILEAIKKRMKR